MGDINANDHFDGGRIECRAESIEEVNPRFLTKPLGSKLGFASIYRSFSFFFSSDHLLVIKV